MACSCCVQGEPGVSGPPGLAGPEGSKGSEVGECATSTNKSPLPCLSVTPPVSLCPCYTPLKAQCDTEREVATIESLSGGYIETERLTERHFVGSDLIWFVLHSGS